MQPLVAGGRVSRAAYHRNGGHLPPPGARFQVRHLYSTTGGSRSSQTLALGVSELRHWIGLSEIRKIHRLNLSNPCGSHAIRGFGCRCMRELWIFAYGCTSSPPLACHSRTKLLASRSERGQ